MAVNIKACIFDLDGVICHTDEFHYLAWKKLCSSMALYFDRDINELLRGVSRRESFEIILRHNNTSLKEEEILSAMDRKNSWYREYLEKMSSEDMEDDVVPSLKELKAEGIKLAVGSSSKNTQLILKRLGITDLFDVIADGTMIQNSKPDPEVFLKAAELINVAPSDCVVIEDALSGLEAAERAGMYRIAYRIEKAEENEKCFKAESFRDIADIVRRI